MARSVVSLRPESFDEGLLWPALERQCSLFDALDDLIPLDGGLLGLAYAVVDSFDAFIADCGEVPLIVATTVVSTLNMQFDHGSTSAR